MAFRLARDAKPPGWHEERLSTRRLPVLVLAAGWQEALERGERPSELARFFLHTSHQKMRDEVLAPYLRGRRWFAAKNEPLDDVRIETMAPWRTDGSAWQVAFAHAYLAGGAVQRYFLPLAIDWETRTHDPMERYQAFGIARVRHRERVGLIYAAFAHPEFARDMARAMLRNASIPVGEGRLRFSSTPLFAPLAEAIGEDVRTPALEQSNTAVFFGSRLFLKGYRRLRTGINPELEVGRFLTEASPFPHIAPILGAAEYVDPGEPEPLTLAILQKFVENQGDMWTLTCDYLTRMLSLPAQAPAAQAGPDAAASDFHLRRMALLGTRVGQMHAALAVRTGDAAFDPEPVRRDDVAGWKAALARELDETLDALEAARARLPETIAGLAAPLLAARERLRRRVEALRPDVARLAKTRYHGDLHLGQVLVAQDDFVIVDFEGEPGRTLEERRAKSCVLRDVAGMLRSFRYAAHAAILRREPGAPPGEQALAALVEWERSGTRAFLDGYRRATAGIASVPRDEAAFAALLDLFLLDKALYELRYEIANRPDWVPIPLRGLLELTGP